jgi:hypothetical protein
MTIKNGKTHIYDYKKYEENPKKGLNTSLSMAEVLYENLLFIGDTIENKKLRGKLRNFINNSEKYARSKNQNYGDNKITKTYIKNSLIDLKLPLKQIQLITL